MRANYGYRFRCASKKQNHFFLTNIWVIDHVLFIYIVKVPRRYSTLPILVRMDIQLMDVKQIFAYSPYRYSTSD